METCKQIGNRVGQMRALTCQVVCVTLDMCWPGRDGALRRECWHVARGNEMNWEMCCDTGRRTVGSEESRCICVSCEY